MSAEPDAMILAENLVKIYRSTEVEVVALQGLDLVVRTGELMAIIGNSGSGKSTLLNIIGGLDIPSAGRIEVAGMNLAKFTDHDFIRYRREVAGFVWQNVARNLVPYLTALQNVELPMMLARSTERRRRRPGAPRARGAARTACTPAWARCRAASSSGRPSPSAWRTSRASSSPTSRPATWTRPPRR